MSPHYVVTFFKRVADSSGHCADIEQGRVKICAAGHPAPAAMEEARRRFAASRGAADWRHRADYAHVAPADPQLCDAHGRDPAWRQPDRRAAKKRPAG